MQIKTYLAEDSSPLPERAPSDSRRAKRVPQCKTPPEVPVDCCILRQLDLVKDHLWLACDARSAHKVARFAPQNDQLKNLQ